MDEEENISGKLYEAEEFPLKGKKLDNIYKMIDLIGGGGMCQVYLATMDTHEFKAKEIIKGRMDPGVLALSRSELGLKTDGNEEITDPEIIELIRKRSKGLSERLKKVITTKIEKEEGDSKLTRPKRSTERVMQTTQMRTTVSGFRTKGNKVAVKILRKGRKKDEETVERFINEAQACKIFNHPNLIKSIDSGETTITLESGEEEKIHYFVMEYVDPYNFEQHNANNPVDTNFGKEILKGILNACEYLHERGTIHRDIKPNNILIDKNSALEYFLKKSKTLDVRLTDLGLAKVNQTAINSDSSDGVTRCRSRDGLIIGTPHYMSPEQIDSPSDIGEASDDWSVSATLYALLTGHFPFAGHTDAEYQIMADITAKDRPRPKSIREYNPDVPQTLDDLITMDFINVIAKREPMKLKNKTTGEYEYIECGDAIKDEKGKVIYIENNRLTASESVIAIRDYENIQQNLHTDKELEALIENENTKEKASLLYFEKLTRIERSKINEKEYDGITVDNRINLLEKAIKNAEEEKTKLYSLNLIKKEELSDLKRKVDEKIINEEELTDGDQFVLQLWASEKRESYLEKMLIYEQNLPKYYEPEPIIDTTKKPLLSPLIKTILLSVLGVGIIGGGIIGGIKGLDYLANTGTYKTIKTDSALVREYLKEHKFDEAIKKLNEIKDKRKNKLPEKFRDVDLEIGQLETYATEELYSAAENAYKQKILGDSRKYANSAQSILEKSNAEDTEELSDKLEKLQKTLDKSDVAISILGLVERKHSGLLETYTNLEKEFADGEPFPKIEEIDALEKNVQKYKEMLDDVIDDFLDEKGNKTKEFQDIEDKVSGLIKNSNRLELRIAQEYLNEMGTLTKQLKGNYFAEKSAEILKQAESLYQKTQQIEQVIDQSYLDPKKIDAYNEKSVEVRANLDKHALEINYFTGIREKAKQGNKAAENVLKFYPQKHSPTKFIKLGDAHLTLGDKEKAREAYKAGVVLAFSGRPVEPELFKNACKQLKLLGQK